MKLAVTGKGGVGKTTFSALLSHALKASGQEVIAIDVDPDSNLAATMGHPEEIRPLVELKELIEERTGAKPGSMGSMFRLNPFVADLPDKHTIDVDGVKVLVAGAVKEAGTGCYCPENALVKALVAHLLLDQQTALVLDMEAGIEHLGRGTIRNIDQLLIVVNPGRRSVETAIRIESLAAGLGLGKVSIVGNGIRNDADIEFLKSVLPDSTIAGFIPWDDGIAAAERDGQAIMSHGSAAMAAVQKIIERLQNED
jgi:CO dehydrogenase maturation factor